MYGIPEFKLEKRVVERRVNLLKAEGIEVGLFRPISLYPFPSEELAKVARRAGQVLCVEMSMGQMVEDVRLAVERMQVVDPEQLEPGLEGAGHASTPMYASSTARSFETSS